MNKPYTYSKLIRGNRFSANYHEAKIDSLLRSSKPDQAELAYHKSQRAYFDEEYMRFVRVQAACGDGTVLIR